MKIGPAVALANLVRLLCRLSVVDEGRADRAIDVIQVWVFQSEMQARASARVDSDALPRDASHEED